MKKRLNDLTQAQKEAIALQALDDFLWMAEMERRLSTLRLPPPMNVTYRRENVLPTTGYTVGAKEDL